MKQIDLVTKSSLFQASLQAAQVYCSEGIQSNNLKSALEKNTLVIVDQLKPTYPFSGLLGFLYILLQKLAWRRFVPEPISHVACNHNLKHPASELCCAALSPICHTIPLSSV